MAKDIQDKNLEIQIRSNKFTADELKNLLQKDSEINKNPIDFEIRSRLPGYRVDPTVLVAVIGGSGVALSALIAGLLKVAESSKSKKIVIRSKSGAEIEVPADTSSEKIEELIKHLRYMDSPRIEM